uniref:Uncharacterized protein n=1 Tax=Anguilla anguilla TaxID=7936 RepID=A0A0E9P6N7_ANGAN
MLSVWPIHCLSLSSPTAYPKSRRRSCCILSMKTLTSDQGSL